MMIYRGFRIDRVVACAADEDRARIEYVITDMIAGFHWQEIGATTNRAQAKEMVDRVADVRDALAKEIGEESTVVEGTLSVGLHS